MFWLDDIAKLTIKVKIPAQRPGSYLFNKADHILSFAAIRQAKGNELGRKLTPAEEKILYNNATAIEVPKDVQQAGPTYGGKIHHLK